MKTSKTPNQLGVSIAMACVVALTSASIIAIMNMF